MQKFMAHKREVLPSTPFKTLRAFNW